MANLMNLVSFFLQEHLLPSIQKLYKPSVVDDDEFNDEPELGHDPFDPHPSISGIVFDDDDIKEPSEWCDYEAKERDRTLIFAASSLAQENNLERLLLSEIDAEPLARDAFHRLQWRNPALSVSQRRQTYRHGMSTRLYLSKEQALELINPEFGHTPPDFDFKPYICQDSPYDVYDLVDAINEARLVYVIRRTVSYNGPHVSAAFDRLQSKGKFFLG